METLSSIFYSLLIDLPSHLIKLVGIVLCIVYWRRYPRAAMLALAGILIIFFQTALGIIFNLWVQRAGGKSIPITSIATYFQVSGFIQSVIRAVGYGLLFAAIFWRNEQPKTV